MNVSGPVAVAELLEGAGRAHLLAVAGHKEKSLLAKRNIGKDALVEGILRPRVTGGRANNAKPGCFIAPVIRAQLETGWQQGP